MTSNFSFWEKRSYFYYDILLIGSGIVGLSAALFLKERQPALKIALLERGFLPSGASTKNAGFACFGSISELVEQEQNSGTDGLHQLIEKRWKGLQKLRGLLGDGNIDFQNLGGHEVFRPEESALAAACLSKTAHFNALIKDIIGHEETFFSAPEKIQSFGLEKVDMLISNRFEAQIDTGKMMYALMQKAMAAGVLIFNNCDVHRFEAGTKSIQVMTTAGDFQCQKLLLTTNAFTRKLLPDADVVPGRGQVLVTRPVPGLKLKGTFHYDKGFYYFRNIGDRVLLGGGRNLDMEGETTSEFGLTEQIQNRLEELLTKMILANTSFEIEQRWSGIMAFGSGISPIIKEVQPNVYCAVRGSGMGVAMGTQTGQDLADLVGMTC